MSAAPRPTKPIVPKRVRPTPTATEPTPLEGARFVVCVPDVTAQLERRRWRAFWRLPLQAAAAVVSLRWLPRLRWSIDLWRLPLQLLSPQLWMQPKLLLPVIGAVVLVLVAAIVQGNRAPADAESPDRPPDWRAPVVDLPDESSRQQAAADAPPAASHPQPTATDDSKPAQPPGSNGQSAAAANVAAHPSPSSPHDGPPGQSPPEGTTGGALSNQPARIEASRPEHRTAQLPERPGDPPRGNVDAQPPTAHMEGKIHSAPADYQR